MSTPNIFATTVDFRGNDDSAVCPSPSQLWLLLNDGLTPDDDGRLSDHAENCRACQQRLDQLSSQGLRDDDRLLRFAGYRLDAELGRGATGVVYLARSAIDGTPVALKMLAGQLAATPEGRKRFEREITALRRLKHPGIVQIFDAGEAEGQAFFTMEFVAGTTLAAQVRSRPLPDRSCAALVAKLAQTMEYAHGQNIIHRDLKPGNILLLPSRSDAAVTLGENTQNRFEPKIADFGIAKLLDDRSERTQTGTVLGTLEYMAPEQLRGDSVVTPATDVYALGAILYDLLTGRPPHRAATLPEMMHNIQHEDPAFVRSLVPGVSPTLELICMKCLQKRPRDRYISAQALADDLNRFLAGRRLVARPQPLWRRAARWGSKRPAAAVSLGATIVGLCGLISGLAAFANQEHRTATAIAAERDEVQKNFHTALSAYRMVIRDIERLSEGMGLDRDEQGEQVERIVVFFEPLLAKDPTNSEYRSILADAWHYRARIPHDADPRGADSAGDDAIVEAYQHTINHCTVLLADPSNQRKFGPLKANTLNNLANIYRARRLWDRAALLYEQSISDWGALVELDRENYQYRAFRANAIGNWAGLEHRRWQMAWADSKPPAAARREVLQPVISRLREAHAEYRIAFEANPRLRNEQGHVALQSKDFRHLVDLLLLTVDFEATRLETDAWLKTCFDFKPAHLDAIRLLARLFAETDAREDLQSLLRRVDDAGEQKVFLEPDVLQMFDEPAFHFVRRNPDFEDRLKRIRATVATGRHL